MGHIVNSRRLVAALAIAGFGFAAPALANNPERMTYDMGSDPARTAEIPGSPAAPAGSAVHAGGGTASDTALAHEVASALAADDRLQGTTITVSANDGRVALSGLVKSSEQGDFAEETAEKVAGRSVGSFWSADG